MTATTKRIVTVWLDEMSDPDNPRCIVDTDIDGGGESETIKTFVSRAQAVMFAEHYARDLGLTLKHL